MNELTFIRELYAPTQPAVGNDIGGVSYLEEMPPPGLRHFVYCFWQLATPLPLATPFSYRVVSDGCIDIFFERGRPEVSFIMGFSRKYAEFAVGNHFDYLGIRFLPSVLPLLFGLSARQLSNQTRPLAEVLPGLARWIAGTIRPDQPLSQLAQRFTGYLDEHMRKHRPVPDPRLLTSLRKILKNRGNLPVEALSVDLSARHLRRVYNFYLGTTPKGFCSVVRFQYLLGAMVDAAGNEGKRAYYDVGFFDQAHFIRDFKRFYGLTPGEALRG